MDSVTIVAITIAVVALAVAAWALMQVRATRHLRSKFGPEYDYTVEREGNQRRAEAELAKREERVKKLHIRNLSPEQRDRFAAEWRETQSRFVDDPPGAVTQADALVTEVMTTRGYPTTDDASVDHPHVMSTYREAHEIAIRNKSGGATTEDLRRATICYRALFEELLGTKPVQEIHEEVRR